MAGRRVVVPGFANKLTALLSPAFPRGLLLAMWSPRAPAQVRQKHPLTAGHFENACKAVTTRYARRFGRTAC